MNVESMFEAVTYPTSSYSVQPLGATAIAKHRSSPNSTNLVQNITNQYFKPYSASSVKPGISIVFANVCLGCNAGLDSNGISYNLFKLNSLLE